MRFEPTLRLPVVVVGAVLLLAAACSAEPAGPDVGDEFEPRSVSLDLVVSGLDQVSDVAMEPSGDRMILLERGGLIRMFAGGELLSEPILDITAEVHAFGAIAGLMQIALDPDYATNGRFFVTYVSRDGHLRVDRHVLAPNATTVEPTGSSPVLAVPLPSDGAVGGALAFGPGGMLYVGVGDGGTSQSADSAQDLRTLLGSVLRLDVGTSEGYTVPSDNPYVGHATARPEIWAHGVHDPRSVSFDPVGGLLVLVESGSAWQEVNVQPTTLGGLDYGWPVLDGSRCFRPETGCDRADRVTPKLEYGPSTLLTPMHGEVYLGTEVEGLHGHFIWPDYWAGWVRSFRIDAEAPAERTEWTLTVRGPRWSGIAGAPGGSLVIFGGPAVYRLEPDG